MLYLKQSTTVNIKMGPFLDNIDGVTPETGLSPTVEVSKNGGAFAARNSVTAITHDAEGWYTVELDVTDTNTVGRLQVKSQDASNHLPVWHEFMVSDATWYNAVTSNGGNSVNANVAEIANVPDASVKLRDVVAEAESLAITNSFNAPTTTTFDLDAFAIYGGSNFPDLTGQCLRFHEPSTSSELRGLSRFVLSQVINVPNGTIEITLDTALPIAPSNGNNVVLYGTRV